MIFLKSFRIVYIIIFLLAVCINPAFSSNTLNDGNKSVQTTPRRIISLSPALTEGLYLLGLEETVVGVTIYCQEPPHGRKKEKIGSIIEPDIEKMVSLKPDLVLAMSLTNVNVIKKLKNLGIRVVVLEIPKDFEELCHIFLQLGKEVGKSDKALELIKESKRRVYHIKNKTNILPKPKVLIQIGTKPFFVATKDYFINDYIEFAGGINIFKDAPSGAASREEAIQRNPDVIIITAMGLSEENESKIWKRFTSIDAVKENKIYFIDPDRLCSPTPVSFVESLEKIVNILHPKRH
jgi:iron complex transport system substrate-binding protein